MILLFEIAGLALLGVVVWILFRAARARPDQAGMRVVAFIGLGGWAAFGAFMLSRSEALSRDPAGLAVNALIVLVILAVVLGYRRVLALLRERAARK